VFVIEGRPDLWMDGGLHPLRPGDGVAFPAGTGIAHCLINNTSGDVRLLIVGENIAGDRVAYPINPEERRPSDDWADAPRRPLGPHDGRADKPPVDCGFFRPGAVPGNFSLTASVCHPMSHGHKYDKFGRISPPSGGMPFIRSICFG
jgi:hypothetical protein